MQDPPRKHVFLLLSHGNTLKRCVGPAACRPQAHEEARAPAQPGRAWAGACGPAQRWRAWLQDMAKPDTARLRRNMSALVNLAKFREEKLADYVEGQRAAEELQQRIWELDDQKKSLVRSPPSGWPAKNFSGALSSSWSIRTSLWCALLLLVRATDSRNAFPPRPPRRWMSVTAEGVGCTCVWAQQHSGNAECTGRCKDISNRQRLNCCAAHAGNPAEPAPGRASLTATGTCFLCHHIPWPCSPW